MKRLTLLLLFLSSSIHSNCQTSSSWLDYLHSIKKNFYLKDSLALEFNIPSNGEAFTALYKPVKEQDCPRLFIHNCDDARPQNFFYSYLISKQNYATLTIFSPGKYTPILTLYNYDPTGKLLQQIEVKSSFMDAGQADSTSTTFIDARNFLVTRWDGYEIDGGNLVDSVTTTNYIFENTGAIKEGKRNSSVKVQK